MKILILISTLIASAAHAITNEDLIQKVLDISPNIVVRTYDHNYASHTSKSLNIVRIEHKKLLEKYTSKSSFRNFVVDCDDYARIFQATSSFRIFRDNLNYACGIMVVKHLKPFGGIRAEGNAVHMLNIVLVNNELVVIEPQTLKSVPLEDYANKDTIYYINF
jgi:hypothetical protein